MKVRDWAKWDKYISVNKDPYGGACVSYARRWAELMETRMSEGDALEAIANETSHTTNIEGITGFMYGAAVEMLSQCWEHGEQLRLWHNLKTRLKKEGEAANAKPGAVLNPALLSIETQ